MAAERMLTLTMPVELGRNGRYRGSADKVTGSEIKEAPRWRGLELRITVILLVRHRSPAASKAVLGRRVVCVVGNRLDDVHDLLRQPAAADGGHCSTIHLNGCGEVFDYQCVHVDSPRINGSVRNVGACVEGVVTP